MTYYELNSIYGHDTFLLDLNGVGAGVKVSSWGQCWGQGHTWGAGGVKIVSRVKFSRWGGGDVTVSG